MHNKLRPYQPHARLVRAKDKIQLYCRYEDRDAAKQIQGYSWNAKQKCWEYPLGHFEEVRETFPFAQVEEGLQQEVTNIKDLEKQVTKAKLAGWADATPIEPMPLKTKPFKHQILGYNIGLSIPSSSQLMEQGCGKSLTALAVAGRRWQRGEVKRLMIFAPASVVPVWGDLERGEFAVHADYPYEVKALEGPVQKRIKTLQDWKPNPRVLQVAVTNYEASWRMDKAILAWGPDMIICDESQRIKTPGAQQSKALHRLGQRAKYRMILTGTPVSNNPLEFFSQYKFLEPSIFGNSFTAFRNRYAVMGGFEGRQVIGYRNIQELMRKAHSIAFRVTKDEALDLPEYTDQTLYCDLEPATKSIYNKLAKESVAELASGEQVTAANVLSRLLRLAQLSGGYMNTEDGRTEQVSKSKMALMSDTLDDLFSADKKVVIFARFIPEIKAIRKLLDDKGMEYAWITGEVPMEARGEEVKRFQTDPNCRAFVAQIQTAGLGITLTAGDTAIFYSLDFSYANYEQCRARIHRLGQKNACTYLHLVARGTVDEKVLGALREKRNMADKVVDNWRVLFQ